MHVKHIRSPPPQETDQTRDDDGIPFVDGTNRKNLDSRPQRALGKG